ncbi:cyclic lactone autoinducer peptide [Ruminiclostridium sufflavum]|nr:cyclic lactone autoinducer peptide [Ruminiclostridium sufflavum]
MKSKFKFLLAALSLLITQLALSGVCSASSSTFHQPKAPKHLMSRNKI